MVDSRSEIGKYEVNTEKFVQGHGDMKWSKEVFWKELILAKHGAVWWSKIIKTVIDGDIKHKTKRTYILMYHYSIEYKRNPWMHNAMQNKAKQQKLKAVRSEAGDVMSGGGCDESSL